jgi:gamma-glutamylaminecyclotransferase
MMLQNQDVRHKQTAERPHRVFVYGTLKEGHGNHNRILKSAIGLGDGEIEGIMFHKGGFPALSLFEKWGTIKGEVYQVTDEELAMMDRLEGHPTWYRRISVDIAPWGSVQTYIFPNELASQEHFIVPTCNWGLGQNGRLPWLGWDKGALVGKFSASDSNDDIAVGPGTRFVLRRNNNAGYYELFEKENNAKLGHYKNLRDLESIEGGSRSTTLKLPPIGNRDTVAARVKEHLAQDDAELASTVVSIIPPPPSRLPAIHVTPSAGQIDDIASERVARKMEAQGLKVRKA